MPTPTRKPALRKAPGRAHPLAPPPAEPAPVAMLCARVPAQLRDEVKIYAVVAGRSVQQIVREAVEHYLAAHWPPTGGRAHPDHTGRRRLLRRSSRYLYT